LLHLCNIQQVIENDYISNVENNRTAMSLRVLIYYAKLVGCSLDSLVGNLDPEYSETALD